MEEGVGVGFAFPDVTAQLLLAAARFQFPPLLTMDGDDTKSHFLPPPPGPTAVRGQGVLETARERSPAGQRAPARGEPRSASRAHTPRGPHAGLPHPRTLAPAGGGRCAQAAAAPPAADPPVPVAPAAQSPGPDRWGFNSSRHPGRRLDFPTRAAACARG